MHIVVVGGGQNDCSLARALPADHDVFVIDDEPPVADTFATMDATFIEGSGTNDEEFGRAGTAKCDVFSACVGLDEVTIVACAIANRHSSPETT